jgi:hypothetical protein
MGRFLKGSIPVMQEERRGRCMPLHRSRGVTGQAVLKHRLCRPGLVGALPAREKSILPWGERSCRRARP